MRGRNIIWTTLVFVLALSAMAIIPTRAQTTANIFIDLPSQSVSVGQVIEFYIKIDDAYTVYGWELRLRLDTDILKVVLVTKGNIFDANPEGSFFVSKKNPGYVDMGETALGLYVSGSTGDYNLAKVKLEVQDIGESCLSIEKTKLINYYLQPLPHTVSPGPCLDSNSAMLTGRYLELREKRVDNRHWDISVMGTEFTFYGKVKNVATDVSLYGRVVFSGMKDGEPFMDTGRLEAPATGPYELVGPLDMSGFMTHTISLTSDDIGKYELNVYAEFSFYGFKWYTSELGMTKDLSFIIEA